MNVDVNNQYIKNVDLGSLPKHVAVIMDGNGRWAKSLGKRRIFGHKNGIDSVRETIESCVELGIKNLTLYVFSIENWKRPKSEVKALMKLLIKSVKNEIVEINKNNIRMRIIGSHDRLSEFVKNELLDASNLTVKNDGLNLNLAISYGSKTEMVDVVKQITSKVKKNIISIENIDEKLINEHLYTKNSKNVDLLIRTGGEFRLSNFLLWQNSYAELLFYDMLWPDFRKKDFYNSIMIYQKRNRRFGKTS
tara:strand:- start:5786 stop:6532 length:747 start_codon:yes stop_codon:yes gene_type:complete